MNCECCSEKTKKRTEDEIRALMNRLNRIEGQVRGLKNMVESDVYCTDILLQVSASTAALNAFSRELLSTHIRAGKDETLDELLQTLQKLMK